MYSAFVVDKAIVGYLLRFHETAPTPTKNMYPVVERRSFASPPQLASQYPLKLTSLLWEELENKQEMKHSRFMKWNNCIN
jgi:hypothetical protein